MPQERVLTVNADDFGFTRCVNGGILHAHLHGILTSTTLMANGAAFGDAVEIARMNPTLDVGAHLVLVQGKSLINGRQLPRTVTELIGALALRRIRPYDEFRAQIVAILDSGIRPTHLDTHKHTHLLPPVLDAVLRLAGELDIRWVRRPFDLPLPASPTPIPWRARAVSQALAPLHLWFQRRLTRRGCRATDHFAGFQLTGRISPEDILHLIAYLPPGITEFMTHPGFCTDQLRSASTRLTESREAELRALTDPRLPAALALHGVRLAPYSLLGKRGS